ncbi:MAG: FlgD immunoglobulin-like domain containing protein [bacterium]
MDRRGRDGRSDCRGNTGRPIRSSEPLRGWTTITFSVGAPTHARLAVYDAAGRLIRTLVDGIIPPGTQTHPWSGTDVNGTPAAAGVYFLRLDTVAGTKTQKIITRR